VWSRKKTKNEKKKLKRTHAGAQCGIGPRAAKAVQKEPGRLWRKGFVKEMSLKSGVKDRGVIDGESECGDCDEAICAGCGELGGE